MGKHVPALQWEDAGDSEADWETAEAPVSVSGVAGSFDIDASAEAGVNLPHSSMQLESES